MYLWLVLAAVCVVLVLAAVLGLNAWVGKHKAVPIGGNRSNICKSQ